MQTYCLKWSARNEGTQLVTGDEMRGRGVVKAVPFLSAVRYGKGLCPLQKIIGVYPWKWCIFRTKLGFCVEGQAFSALILLVIQQEGIWCVKTEWLGASVVICLGRGADLHMAQMIVLPLTVSCSRKSRLVLVLSFWYWLTQVVLDKIQRTIKRL